MIVMNDVQKKLLGDSLQIFLTLFPLKRGFCNMVIIQVAKYGVSFITFVVNYLAFTEEIESKEPV